MVMYTSIAETHRTTEPQTNEPTNQRTDKLTDQQANEPTTQTKNDPSDSANNQRWGTCIAIAISDCWSRDGKATGSNSNSHRKRLGLIVTGKHCPHRLESRV